MEYQAALSKIPKQKAGKTAMEYVNPAHNMRLFVCGFPSYLRTSDVIL